MFAERKTGAWLAVAGLVVAGAIAGAAGSTLWAQDAAQSGADEPGAPSFSYDFASVLSENGLPWGLLIAFATGVLVSFTPCVYPMIPITIGIIAGREERPSLTRSLALSCIYVLGLAIVYAALGVVVGTVGAAFRNVLMSPYVLVGVAALFVALALSMFGLYELQVPASLATRLQSVGGAGALGVLLIGMVSGIIASPCTAAPLAGILAFVAVSGDAVKGFLLLFAFAWGMGLLLIVVGTSAGALKSLPKSGEWMVDFKHLFGFVFLGVALYFVRTLIPELVYYLGLSACLVAGGIAFGALDSLPLGPGTGLRLKKGIAVAIAVLGFYVLIGTLWNRGLLLPPRPTAAVVPLDRTPLEPEPAIQWQTDIGEAFKTASEEGKLVLLDFRADWCELCNEMEEEAFVRPEIVDAISRFVPLRVDVTELNEEEEALVDKYELPGYPTLVIANGDGQMVDSVSGYEGPEKLLGFLQAHQSAPEA